MEATPVAASFMIDEKRPAPRKYLAGRYHLRRFVVTQRNQKAIE
jgi:hypothetical protein